MSSIKLGLDLGSNSIGWALIDTNPAENVGSIIDLGARIIPLETAKLIKYEEGNPISATADRTKFRSARRLIERHLLRRERLHRALFILDFLPTHYAAQIDFKQRLGQFKLNTEPKLAFQEVNGKLEFLFNSSFIEMLSDFEKNQPTLLESGRKVPLDWTVYYLRTKALNHKLSKHELAWLMLHFNQKRGYYQTRGEEAEGDSNKNVSFEILSVESVIKTEEIIKSSQTPLFKVVFTNGWEYNRLIAKPEDWIGKSREFIVTTSILKSGEIKRDYKKVDSESDWLAIKSKTEKSILESDVTVGEYIYHNLLVNPSQKIRGKLVRTIDRDYYKRELIRILEKQKEYHPELTDSNLLAAVAQELYPNNELHRKGILEKGMLDLLVNDIIFYQRPLKSKKSLISNCSFEQRIYKDKSGNYAQIPIKSIAKSHPLYQEFRVLQFLQNLRIYHKSDRHDVDITHEILLSRSGTYQNTYNWLINKREIKQEDLLKFLGLEDRIKEALGEEEFKRYKKDKTRNIATFYRWNYVTDKTYKLNETRADILSRLGKIGVSSEFLSENIEQALWHILYSVEDTTDIRKALTKFKETHSLPDEFVTEFVKYPAIKKEYGTLSEKALKKVLAIMRFGDKWRYEDIDKTTQAKIQSLLTGEADQNVVERVREKTKHLERESDFQNLPFWLATYIIYNRHAETSDAKKWQTPTDIEPLKQHELRNPIVEKVINETLKLVKDLWIAYGKGQPNFFSEIHIELGRDMKNPAAVRKQMAATNIENEATNLRLKRLLMEFSEDKAITNVRPYSPIQQEILKIYEEGVYHNENNENTLKEIDSIRKSKEPSKAELTKYKLWLQQGYKSPYTGSIIPLARLFTPEYEIEHIIPQSRFFDDSLGNKIICESAVNSLKDNQLAYEFIKNHRGQIVQTSNGSVQILSVEAYEENVRRYFSKSKGKLKRLLMDEIPAAFIERQLNDNRYISRIVKSLLSNIVREENEQEDTAKRVIVSSGGVTARLRQDWGLNDIWNDIVTPRFQRLNQLTNSLDFGSINPTTNKFLPQVPLLLQKGFNKKRIDHRHHALDALVVACATRNHVNYLNNAHAAENQSAERYNLRTKLRHVEQIVNHAGKTLTVAKDFIKPWPSFTQDARLALETTIVSYKRVNRIINKNVNKSIRWEKQSDGSLKKVLVKQTKGELWSIRKSLHKDTVSGLVKLQGRKLGKGEITTATRKALTPQFTEKQLNDITDASVRNILNNHLAKYDRDFALAFSPEGIEDMNANIVSLNNGKFHQPIFKVRVSEQGSGRFKVGVSGNKVGKYVESDAGSNTFFGIYVDSSGKRSFTTFPLREIIERQKQGAIFGEKPWECSVPPMNDKGDKLLFSLSPNEVVYIPTAEEIENPSTVDFSNLSKQQVGRIYTVNDFSGTQCYFSPINLAKAIMPKEVDLKWDDEKNKLEGSFSTKTAKVGGVQLKDICWKLEVDRLGKITSCKR